MLLINNGTNPFAYNGFVLPKGVRTEVPEDIAKKLLEINGVEKYIEQTDLEKAAKDAKAEADAKIKTLEAQIETLKAELAKAQENKTESKTEDKTAQLDALKKEADALGVEYPANIGAVKLQERIDKKKAETAQN